MKSAITIAAAASTLLVGISQAQTIDHTYTRLDAEDCVMWEGEMEGGGYGSTLDCPGPDGWTLHLFGGEHGASSAYRLDEDTDWHYGQAPQRGPFGHFNTVVEWRLHDGAPVATIHRYLSQSPGSDGLWETGGVEYHDLLITVLRPGEAVESCVAAAVDATTLSGANAIAAEAADRLAQDFDCEGDTRWRIDASAPSLDAAMAAGSTY